MPAVDKKISMELKKYRAAKEKNPGPKDDLVVRRWEEALIMNLPDPEWLCAKVAILFGINGGLRASEYRYLSHKNIKILYSLDFFFFVVRCKSLPKKRTADGNTTHPKAIGLKIVGWRQKTSCANHFSVDGEENVKLYEKLKKETVHMWRGHESQPIFWQRREDFTGEGDDKKSLGWRWHNQVLGKNWFAAILKTAMKEIGEHFPCSFLIFH